MASKRKFTGAVAATAAASLSVFTSGMVGAQQRTGIDLQLTPPMGLCQVDPSRSKADDKIWQNVPGGELAKLPHALFIDCRPLEAARKGDWSGKQPANVLYLAELPRVKGQNPPIPYSLSEMISVLVKRDTPKSKTFEDFFDRPKETSTALLGSDANGVYYGTRKSDSSGNEIGGAISTYTMIGTSPVVLMSLFYETTMDVSKFKAAKLLAAQLQAENKPLVRDRATPSASAKFRQKVISCISLPPGAEGHATIAFEIKSDGSLAGKPTIVEGQDPANNVYANAIVRGILKCQPYADIGLQGPIQLKFRSSPE